MIKQCEKCHDDIKPVKIDDVKYMRRLGVQILCADCNNRIKEDEAKLEND